MREERTVTVDGMPCTVVISDEKEALLAADAAGRASVALWREGGEFLPAAFAVERPEDADEEFLERVARRKLGLPWVIAGTERLILREFGEGDFEEMEAAAEDSDGLGPDAAVFQNRETFLAYIRRQYPFFQFGIWAAVERESGRIVGRLGFGLPEDGREGLELGYHIFAPWRGRGYGREGCKAALEWQKRELGLPVYARIHRENTASQRLAASLGFVREREPDLENEGDILHYKMP